MLLRFFGSFGFLLTVGVGTERLLNQHAHPGTADSDHHLVHVGDAAVTTDGAVHSASLKLGSSRNVNVVALVAGMAFCYSMCAV